MDEETNPAVSEMISRTKAVLGTKQQVSTRVFILFRFLPLPPFQVPNRSNEPLGEMPFVPRDARLVGADCRLLLYRGHDRGLGQRLLHLVHRLRAPARRGPRSDPPGGETYVTLVDADDEAGLGSGGFLGHWCGWCGGFVLRCCFSSS